MNIASVQKSLTSQSVTAVETKWQRLNFLTVRCQSPVLSSPAMPNSLLSMKCNYCENSYEFLFLKSQSSINSQQLCYECVTPFCIKLTGVFHFSRVHLAFGEGVNFAESEKKLNCVTECSTLVPSFNQFS